MVVGMTGWMEVLVESTDRRRLDAMVVRPVVVWEKRGRDWIGKKKLKRERKRVGVTPGPKMYVPPYQYSIGVQI